MRYALIRNGDIYGVGGPHYMYELLSDHICSKLMHGRTRTVYDIRPYDARTLVRMAYQTLHDDSFVQGKPSAFHITHIQDDVQTTYASITPTAFDELLRTWFDEPMETNAIRFIVTITETEPLPV